ncbi:hypothetical protein DLAC_03874 [Tieghemostelium lacteum]|uniref:Uncharacterized protein n=1 Tax=Tieghemostelium lacteum TaxID=361077 RepID=A0A152A0Y4_TIELA|nr:hypothetical protein DLAC_03874 [Tieghemostelium lacteum]|eukprot:KYQ99907.1 hypothetical protein DLAC_03874 [Tieghemostelium lacteum]
MIKVQISDLSQQEDYLQLGQFQRHYQAPCGSISMANVTYSSEYGFSAVASVSGMVIFQNVTFINQQQFTGQAALYVQGVFNQWTPLKGVAQSQYQFYATYAPASGYNGGTDYFYIDSCKVSDEYQETEQMVALY